MYKQTIKLEEKREKSLQRIRNGSQKLRLGFQVIIAWAKRSLLISWKKKKYRKFPRIYNKKAKWQCKRKNHEK